MKYNEAPMPWSQVVELLLLTQLEKQGDTGNYHVARIKQWLGYLRKAYHEADGLFSGSARCVSPPDRQRHRTPCRTHGPGILHLNLSGGT